MIKVKCTRVTVALSGYSSLLVLYKNQYLSLNQS
nr:MAG TPA: hypothetical protein [Caudoviricetes sp.]